MAVRGDSVNILSYHERKRVWSVHIFYEPTHMENWEIHGVWEVYYQKKGFPMMFAFGLPDYQKCENKHYNAYDALDIAWGNIDNYKEMFI